MIYLERKPAPALQGILRSLWYCHAPETPVRRERVLPNGCMQVVISLAADHLTECSPDGSSHPIPPSIVVGARGRYEILHSRDYAELVGFVFRPGGLGPWLRQRASLFFEQSVDLTAAWPHHDIPDRLREAPTPAAKLALADTILTQSLRGRALAQPTPVRQALPLLRRTTVRETARTLGLSERRLHQIFCEDVGLSPKLWSRVARFQRAVTALHTGEPMRWDQLALACGYYDQPHFSHDFRAFSGIDPTTYSAHQGPWKNHIPDESTV